MLIDSVTEDSSVKVLMQKDLRSSLTVELIKFGEELDVRLRKRKYSEMIWLEQSESLWNSSSVI